MPPTQQPPCALLLTVRRSSVRSGAAQAAGKHMARQATQAALQAQTLQVCCRHVPQNNAALPLQLPALPSEHGQSKQGRATIVERQRIVSSVAQASGKRMPPHGEPVLRSTLLYPCAQSRRRTPSRRECPPPRQRRSLPGPRRCDAPASGTQRSCPQPNERTSSHAQRAGRLRLPPQSLPPHSRRIQQRPPQLQQAARVQRGSADGALAPLPAADRRLPPRHHEPRNQRPCPRLMPPLLTHSTSALCRCPMSPPCEQTRATGSPCLRLPPLHRTTSSSQVRHDGAPVMQHGSRTRARGPALQRQQLHSEAPVRVPPQQATLKTQPHHGSCSTAHAATPRRMLTPASQR